MLGLFVVSLPFLFAAIQKKISWQFFWSWTLTSVFATLTFLFTLHNIDKKLEPQTKFMISMGFGMVFVLTGLYMRRIQSPVVRKMGWLFIVFGVAWSFLSLPL